MNITEGPENQYGRSRWQQHLFCKILKFLKLTRQTFSTEPGRALKLRPTFSSPGIPHHLLSPGGARCDVQLGMYSRSRQKKNHAHYFWEEPCTSQEAFFSWQMAGIWIFFENFDSIFHQFFVNKRRTIFFSKKLSWLAWLIILFYISPVNLNKIGRMVPEKWLPQEALLKMNFQKKLHNSVIFT